MPLAAEELAGPRAIEQQAEPGDVAARTDLLILDGDAGDDRIERRVGQPRRLGGRASVDPRPQHLPALALRHPPAAGARGLGILARDVHGDAGHLVARRAVHRRDAAIAALELGIDDAARHAERQHGQRHRQRAEKTGQDHGASFDELGVENQARYGYALGTW